MVDSAYETVRAEHAVFKGSANSKNKKYDEHSTVFAQEAKGAKRSQRR